MFQKTKVYVGVVALLGIALQVPAAAQERVEVTGSRIRTIAAETSQPILTVTAEEIAKTGLVTVGDIVNSLSIAGTPAFSKGAVLTANREMGGQYASLRNLGAQRVLVLVNGKRWSQSVGGFTDMSTIPSSMIERVEILKDGASAVYGSDAIAGVINFILKRSLNGGSVSAYAGVNESGDGKSTDFNLTYGVTGEKSSLMFGYTYSKVDPIWAKDREITAFSFGPDNKTAGLGGGPWGRARFVNPANGNFLTLAAGGVDKMLIQNGTYDGLGVGQDSRNIANYRDVVGGAPRADDNFNPTQQMMFTIPSELQSIFARGVVELTPTMRLGSTAMFASRKSARQVAGFPLSSLSQSAFPVYVDKDSYFNPYGNQGVGVTAGAGRDVFFNRRTIEVPRVTQNKNDTFHIDATLDGDFKLAQNNWTWAASINYSKVSGSTTSTGNINLLNLKRALGPSFLNAAGQVQCGTAAAPIALGDCVPFNILGGPSASTAEALNYVMSVGQGTFFSTVRSTHLDLTGELMKLPGGMLALAAGLEFREVKGADVPGQFEQSGYSTDLAARTTRGKYEVDEGYVELNVPILKGVPGAHELALNVASRQSKYSNFGNTTNSKVSLQWRPIRDVMVRGTYAEGFRAPVLADTFGGGSQTFDSYLDPCDSVHGQTTNAAVAARCTAQGVPAGFRQVNQVGAPVASGGGQTPFAFQSGAGNAFLQPETATTQTLGLVLSPRALPGLFASVDWYLIEIENRIAAVSAAFILNQCLVQGVGPFCSLFSRDPVSGQVNNLRRGNANLGELKTEGFDVALAYQFPTTSLGRFGIKSETTYTSSYEIKSSPTANWTNFVGDFNGSAYYRVKSNISLDWSLGSVGVTLGTRYFSSLRTNCWNVTARIECTDAGTGFTGSATGFNREKALVYNDLSVSYTTPWKGRLLVGANNVFDVKPRINYATSSSFGGPSSSSSVDPDLPIDRFFFVRYSQTF
jgi:iron complex outermembrane recepter protein